jgi:hypothetical protein
MSDKKPTGIQVDTINRYSPFVQQSLDLKKQDQFVTGAAVEYIHYKALPSPLGQKDRGDYRRSDGVDTITSNGMIYKCAGKFSATMTDNNRGSRQSDSGESDFAQGRLVLPRFYNTGDQGEQSNGDRIYLAPGDRIYAGDPNVDDLVSNYHKMDYEQEIDNVPMFPIVKLEVPIIDSQNIEYICGVDYQITPSGNIRWIAGGRNPGIDPDTGKGRVYSIRYLYRAYWYVLNLPKEVRITGVTNGNVRTPERMPMLANIVREYIYHNQNKGDLQNANKSKTPDRADAAPVESISPDKYAIPVDMSSIGDDGEQS